MEEAAVHAALPAALRDAGQERDCYERGVRVRALLWRWEQASRDAMRLTCLLSGRVPESERIHRQPQMFQNLVNLVVDVERLLLALPEPEFQVVLEIGLDGRRERWVARKLRLSEEEVARAYWRGILQLDAGLVAGGYLAG